MIERAPAAPTRRVGCLLFLLLFWVPLFAPITLLSGFSRRARLLAFGWLILDMGASLALAKPIAR